MSLETATFIDQLDGNQPPSNDPKSQGDDHLRLIKNVLKNSIKRVTRAFYVPNVLVNTGNYTVVASDDNRTIANNTSGGNITLTLPTLVSSDAGWCIYVLKTNTDPNPVFIAPPSGNINGFSKVRRTVEYVLTKVLWNGTTFTATRPGGVPIGASIPFFGSALPNGFLWPDGTTFTASDFVELNTALGGNIKPDLRGRFPLGKDNMGGSAANRVTNAGSGVDGVTLGASGGAQNVTLDATMIPAHVHPITDKAHSHQITNVNANQLSGPVGGAGVPNSASGLITLTTDSKFTGITSTDNSTGGGLAHNNMPPALVTNYILVAE